MAQESPAPETAPPTPELAPQRAAPSPTVSIRTPRSNGAVATASLLSAAIVQAKLSVGPANDPFEREADAIAARVVSALRAPGVTATQTLDAPPRVQRSAAVGLAGGDVDAGTERAIRSARGGGQPLPDSAKSKMESAFGVDFGAIRVHSGPVAADLNDRIQAKAFTTGRDIFFRDGVPDASTAGGQELLAHELTHTIQQGAVSASPSTAVQRTVGSWASPTPRIRAAVSRDGGTTIRRGIRDGKPNKMPPHLTAAYFKAHTSVRGAKRGESLSTIDKWLGKVESARTYDDQQYAMHQVVDATQHWLNKHPLGAGATKKSVEKRRAAVESLKGWASGADRSPATPPAPAGAGAAPEGADEHAVEVLEGILDAVADGSGITGDYADRNLDLDNVGAIDQDASGALSAEGGAGLNSTPFDFVDSVNIVSGLVGGAKAFKDLRNEDNDRLDDAEAGGRVLASAGQGIHGAYKLTKAIAVSSGGDSTSYTQVGDIGAAYADGLGAIAGTITTIKAFRDARKKGAEQGGLTTKEKLESGAEVIQGGLAAGQMGTKAVLDITKAATEVGAKHAIAGLSTAAGAIGIVVSTIEIVRGGMQIYYADSAKKDIASAEAQQDALVADVSNRIDTAIASSREAMASGKPLADVDELLKSWYDLKGAYEDLLATREQYRPAMDAMKKLQDRQMEAGAFKVAGGTVGVVSGALLLSGVGAPIAVGVAALGGIIALTEAGVKLARNSAASGLIAIARRLDDDGKPVGRPEEAPSYRDMERRVYAAYYANLTSVIKSSTPWVFEDGEFAAIKQFAWDDKKSRLDDDQVERVDGFAAVASLSASVQKDNWIEVAVGEKVHKEAPTGSAMVARRVKPSAHKSSQAMEASKDDIVDALFDLGRGSFDQETGKFADVPVVAVGDADLVENMKLITVHGLLSAADITSERWAAWAETADDDFDKMRSLIRAQL